MLHDLEEICPQCLKALIWSWAHGANIKAALIKEEAEAVRSEYRKPNFELSNINKRLDHIEKLASEIITESLSPFQMWPIPANSLIEERIEGLRKSREYQDIVFRLDLDPSEPRVMANPAWLRRVLDILIDNAREAMTENSGGQILIDTSIDGQRVRIAVSDKGHGLGKQTPWPLFEKPSQYKPGGRGRGAYIARILIDIYGGNISVDSTGPEGTTVAIRLPLIARERLGESTDAS